MKRNKQKIIAFTSKVLFFIFVSEMLAIGVLAISENRIVMNTLLLATTGQPEKFTELYFEDHLKLPKTIDPNKEQPFAFTVHNLENQNKTYTYEVYKDINGLQIIIDKGEFTLKQDQSRTILESYNFVQAVEKAKIVVNLTNKKQQIAFWLEGTK